MTERVLPFYKMEGVGNDFVLIEADAAQGLEIRVRSLPAAREARMWFASSADDDLRESRWASAPMTRTHDGGWQGFLQRPRRGRATACAELVFDIDGRLFTLTTQLKVLEANPQ